MKAFSALATLIVYLSYVLTFLIFGKVKLDLTTTTAGWILFLMLLLACFFHFCYAFIQFKQKIFTWEKQTCSLQAKIWVINFWIWQGIMIFGSVIYFLVASYWPKGSMSIQVSFYILLPVLFVINTISSILESIVRIRCQLLIDRQQSPVKNH